MLKVEMWLHDHNERAVFGQAVDIIEQYRAQKMAALHGEAAPGQRVEDPEVKAQAAGVVTKDTPIEPVPYIGQEPEPQVVATITPEGVTKAPSPAEMTAATQAAINRVGTAKVREILLAHGAGQVMKIPTAQWPATLAALEAAQP